MPRTKTKTTDQPTLIVDNGKTDVAVQKQGGAVAVATADPIFAIIERLSKDPDFNVDKMERLIAMHAQAKATQAQAEFDQAMSRAQQQMITIVAKSKSDKGKYANYATLDKAIRPIYTEHGFSVSFDTAPDAPELTVRLVATVAHSGGHRERRQLDVPADGKGAKGGDVMTRTHATASAVTYGKRYLSSMIWNLAVERDDDGDSASSVAERAKVMADNGITHLNSMSPPTKEALASWDAKNATSIAWLKKNAPEQFERYQTAYSNAAQAAGISKDEPKRGDTNKTSTAATPHSKPSQGGAKLAREDDQGAGSVRTPEASGTPTSKITDVVDDDALWPERPKAGEKLEFLRYAKTADFCEFAETFLPRTNKLGAEQFAEWFDGTLIAMERGKKGSQDAAAEIREQLKALIEPGAEG